jgi:hypothetical protein
MSIFVFIMALQLIAAYNIKTYSNLLINLDDLVDYHHNQNLVDLMTRLCPITQKYKNKEFAITSHKLDEIFTNTFFTTQIKLNGDNTIYHEYAIKHLKHLSEQTESQFSVIYSKNVEMSKIAIDYYISKIATLNNNIKNKTQVVKNCKKLQLQQYWDLATPIKILRLKKNDVLFSSIMCTELDINMPYISNIEKFIE